MQPNIEDLSTALITVAPTPAISGGLLLIEDGRGGDFPATPFDAIMHPEGQMPTRYNSEQVIVTNVTDDAFTIVRGQGVTTAKEIQAGWRISGAIFAEHILAVYDALAAKENTANKGIANGYAPLDASAIVPAANMRVFNDRGVLTASTQYNRWDIVTYRGRKILVTQTSSSGSGTNPFFSASNYMSLGPENVIYAYDHGYRADGNQATATANTTALQAAVNLAAALQARVVVPPGFGYITSPGIELKDKVVIEGAGAYASIIALANNANCNMFYNHVSTNGTSDANAQWCGIMNLGLDGRKTSQNGAGPYYGIYFTTNPLNTKASADANFDPSHIVLNVHVRNAHDDGVYIAGRSDVRLIGVKVSFAGGNGFRLSFDTHADHCIAEVSARAGFVMPNSSTQLTGCKSFLSGTGTDASGTSYPEFGFGYLVDGGTGGAYLGEIAIAGCDSQQDTASGLKLINVQGASIAALTIAENSYNNANLRTAVVVDNSFYNNIEVSIRARTGVNALLLTTGSDKNNITIGFASLPANTAGAILAAGNANLTNYVRVNGAQLSPTLTKNDVSLGNVDNTSDASKPISTATQSALDLKASITYVDTASTADRLRSNHTGTQTAATISDFSTAADARITLQKAQNNGLATLDGSGKIPTSQIPDLAISVYLGNFTDTTAALANAGVLASQRGDWFTVDTSGGQTYIVISDAPTTTGHISLLKTPTGAVSSVNGQTGIVVLNTSNIAESGNLYYTDSRADARAAAAIAADTTHILKAGDTMTGTLTSRTVLPSTSATYDLGGSAAYYSNIYAQRHYLNTTAYLDGAIAGSAVLTGLLGLAGGTPTHSLTLPSTATGIRYYNTSDQTTNPEYVTMSWSANIFAIQTGRGGTGTQRALRLATANRILDVVDSGDTAGYVVARSDDSSAIANFGIRGTSTASTGIKPFFQTSPTVNQTSTAGYYGWFMNITESATGSGTKRLIELQVGGASKFGIDNTGKIVSPLIQTYAPVNDSTLRSFDPATVTLSQLGNIVATMIRDDRSLGLKG